MTQSNCWCAWCVEMRWKKPSPMYEVFFCGSDSPLNSVVQPPTPPQLRIDGRRFQ